ncbi:MAG: hypothetical protein H8E83_01085 [Planctomycetes bacterium]|nr:hypothetical protein [Planctomycetota bacterium]
MAVAMLMAYFHEEKSDFAESESAFILQRSWHFQKVCMKRSFRCGECMYFSGTRCRGPALQSRATRVLWACFARPSMAVAMLMAYFHEEKSDFAESESAFILQRSWHFQKVCMKRSFRCGECMYFSGTRCRGPALQSRATRVLWACFARPSMAVAMLMAYFHEEKSDFAESESAFILQRKWAIQDSNL